MKITNYSILEQFIQVEATFDLMTVTAITIVKTLNAGVVKI